MSWLVRSAPAHTLALAVTALATLALPLDAQQRPMDWMDVQRMRQAGSWAPSPDGEWMLYTLSTPDWDEAESYSDIHIVSLAEGVPSSRRLTFTDQENETNPTWAPDGSFFAFASPRDRGDGRSGRQLYVMRPDGGEARRVTDEAEGVSDFRFSPDGRWLVYRAGESGLEQLWRLAVEGLDNGGDVPESDSLTDEPAGIDDWDFSPAGAHVYFTRPDTFLAAEKERREKGFTVDIRNPVTPLAKLYRLDLETKDVERLTDSEAYSVDGFEISPDGRWIGFQGGSPERYERNITGAGLYRDLYLLEVTTGDIERLTENHEVGEGGFTFSPDTRLVAFSAPDDLSGYSMTENRVYVREVGRRGEAFRKIGGEYDGSIYPAFWSDDGATIYFNDGIKVTNQLFSLEVASGEVRQITDERAALGVSKDDDTGTLLINYSDPATPPTLFTVDALDHVGDRARWRQLIEANPQVSEIALGREVEVEWTSTDGKTVGGVLVYPVDYREGERYPLIVAIHGGPASADVLRFNGGYGAQVYAGAGYAVLKPNYRGSTGYGNAHRTDIVGDYFTLGYDDIMTGVDHLIAEGIVDGDRMGVLGWSAGGHWSNWILTQTDRFKAISSGAGTMNWISMYAQSDVQRNRQYYIGDAFLYENFDPYWDQSPLKYIAGASTPTMVHVVEGDPRVPSPQSVELHMALKKLGVPTELFMYPGRSHGIPDARNRLVKSVSEMAWMDHYVRGVGETFRWEQVLETLAEEAEERTAEEGGGGPGGGSR
jgi:dipeptidyl aminopeptidase/acylaminoacyl peptidase